MKLHVVFALCGCLTLSWVPAWSQENSEPPAEYQEMVKPPRQTAVELSATEKIEFIRELSDTHDVELAEFGAEGFCSGELPEAIREQYRILWWRAFHPPVFAILTIEESGRVIAESMDLSDDPRDVPVTKKTSSWVDVCTHKARIFNEDVEEFCSIERQVISSMTEKAFWALPIVEDTDSLVFDGTSWLIEGRRGKQCHAVERKSPDVNSEFFQFAWYVLSAADRQLLFSEVY